MADSVTRRCALATTASPSPGSPTLTPTQPTLSRRARPVRQSVPSASRNMPQPPPPSPTILFTPSLTAGSVPTVSGGRFARGITVKSWATAATIVFEPPTSVAVTVTSAVPADTGLSVTRLPNTDTDVVDGADELEPYVGRSLSASRKATDTSTVTGDSSTPGVAAGSLPTASRRPVRAGRHRHGEQLPRRPVRAADVGGRHRHQCRTRGHRPQRRGASGHRH